MRLEPPKLLSHLMFYQLILSPYADDMAGGHRHNTVLESQVSDEQGKVGIYRLGKAMLPILSGAGVFQVTGIGDWGRSNNARLPTIDLYQYWQDGQRLMAPTRVQLKFVSCLPFWRAPLLAIKERGN